MSEFAQAIAAGGAALGAILAMLRFFAERREKRAAVRQAFAAVVSALAQDNQAERLAAAILLRRFFDPRSEVGLSDTPFAADAVNVIASLLRIHETGNFQKLLADGLVYAPSLRYADLQKTNLQMAYLGMRTGDPVTGGSRRAVDLGHADFYRADLSGASLKGAAAQGAQFYQARLIGTVLKGADLRDANFFAADLRGARFDGALLKGASFAEARNLPPALAASLDTSGRYAGAEPFVPTAPSGEHSRPRVFVSRSGCLGSGDTEILKQLVERLRVEEFEVAMVARADYPESGSLGEVSRVLSGCDGAVALGSGDLEVSAGLWRRGTRDESVLAGAVFATPWLQIEAGMAIMRGIPLLCLSGGPLRGGVFDLAGSEHNLFRLAAPADLDAPQVADWLAAVREQAARPG